MFILMLIVIALILINNWINCGIFNRMVYSANNTQPWVIYMSEFHKIMLMKETRHKSMSKRFYLCKVWNWQNYGFGGQDQGQFCLWRWEGKMAGKGHGMFLGILVLFCFLIWILVTWVFLLCAYSWSYTLIIWVNFIDTHTHTYLYVYFKKFIYIWFLLLW